MTASQLNLPDDFMLDEMSGQVSRGTKEMINPDNPLHSTSLVALSHHVEPGQERDPVGQGDPSNCAASQLALARRVLLRA